MRIQIAILKKRIGKAVDDIKGARSDEDGKWLETALVMSIIFIVIEIGLTIASFFKKYDGGNRLYETCKMNERRQTT